MASLYIPSAFKFKASHLAKLVLAFLADTADEYGRVSYSHASIAEKCSITIDEAKIAIEELVSKRAVVLEPFNQTIREFETRQHGILRLNNTQENDHG